MLRCSRRLLVKKRRVKKKSGRVEEAKVVRGEDGEVVNLEGFYTKEERGGFETAKGIHMKHVNVRRKTRKAEFDAQQPRVPGANMQPWLGYGFMDHNPHPLHDLSHEELAEYVAGTEYAELPEVEGANADYPRLPKSTDLIEKNTTGFERGSEMHLENFDKPIDVFGGETYQQGWLSDPTYMSKDPRYDVDLTQDGAKEAWEEENSKNNRELQHAYIKNTPRYEATSMMKWNGDRWIKAKDPDFQPFPHESLSTAIATAYLDDDTDLGPDQDGGYQQELAKFAGMSQSSAGAEFSDMPEGSGGVDVEGDVTPKMIATSSPVAPRMSGFIEEEQQEAVPSGTDFLDLMSVPEDAVSQRPIEKTINGVAVDALDTANSLVDPSAVNVEHENFVFSGLYPRGDEEMSDFEKQRLARCMEMHVKQGVPLAGKGVDPYSTSAFVRGKGFLVKKGDDNVGRKHDLAVEFRLRQKLKLSHDSAKLTRPAVRLTEDNGKVFRYHGTIYDTNRSMMLRNNTSNLSPGAFLPEGGVKDGKWKVYGDTKFTAMGSDMLTWRFGQLFHRGPSAFGDFGVTYVSAQKGWTTRQAERLERATKRKIWVEKMREKKRIDYEARMAAKASGVEQQQQHQIDPLLTKMRMATPDAEDIELEQFKLQDPHSIAERGDPSLAPHPDPRSTWGRNPWRHDIRYTGWHGVKTHWRDIKPENLQLRGTGWHDQNALGDTKYEPPGRKLDVNRMDFLGWRYSQSYSKEMWSHFNRVVSKGNHLVDAGFTQEELPPAGQGRENTNDLIRPSADGTNPLDELDWAFVPKWETAKGEEKEKFDWNKKVATA